MTKLIPDPIFKTIKIEDSIINDLINTIEFQRMRRIAQLGLLSYAIPTATHTRFSHSLGVYELARRFLGIQKIGKDNKYYLPVLISALLHDVGHGPNSHLFERVSKYSHESYSIELINSADSEINKVIRKYDESLLKKITNILSGTNKNSWYTQIISSNLDVDRMDYLLRDSYFTGIKYGDIDSDFILRNLRIDNGQLIFNRVLETEIERFFLGRYFMYKNVYLNKRGILISELFIFFLNRINFLRKSNFNFSNNYDTLFSIFTNKKINYSDFIKLDDFEILTLIKNSVVEKDSILQTISKSFLKGKDPKVRNLNNLTEEKKFTSEMKAELKGQNWSILDLESNINFYMPKNLSKFKLFDPETKKIQSLENISQIIGSTSKTLKNYKKTKWGIYL